MPIETLAARNMTQGLNTVFVYINDITYGYFIRLLLFMVWIGIVFGVFYYQKRQNGVGDFSMSIVVGCIVTMIVTIMLSLIDGLVDSTTYAIVFVLMAISIMLFFFVKE